MHLDLLILAVPLSLGLAATVVFSAFRLAARLVDRGSRHGVARDLELISDGAIRDRVILSPFSPPPRWPGRTLSDDGLHPKDEGNRFLAGSFPSTLRRRQGEAILKEGIPADDAAR